MTTDKSEVTYQITFSMPAADEREVRDAIFNSMENAIWEVREQHAGVDYVLKYGEESGDVAKRATGDLAPDITPVWERDTE